MDVRTHDQARHDDDTLPIDLRDADEEQDRDGVISGLATLSREWGSWPSARIDTVARAVILAAGVVLFVAGAVALLRTGFSAGLVDAHVTVGWLHHTPLLGLLHVAVGLGLLVAASVAVRGDGSATLIGALFVVFGLITLIEPGGLHPLLATHTAHGSTYLVIGLAIAARDFLTR